MGRVGRIALTLCVAAACGSWRMSAQADLLHRTAVAGTATDAASLPSSIRTYELAVLDLARAARVPVGLESMPETGPGPVSHPPSASAPQATFAGRSVIDVLRAFDAAFPGYRWKEADGVIEISPASAGPSPLDSIASGGAASLTNVTLGGALEAVRAALDPTAKPREADASAEEITVFLSNGPTGLKVDDSSERAMKASEALLQQTFSVAAPGASVRTLLDSIVRAHGGLTGWIVRYPTVGSHQMCQVAFALSTGWEKSIEVRLAR